MEIESLQTLHSCLKWVFSSYYWAPERWYKESTWIPTDVGDISNPFQSTSCTSCSATKYYYYCVQISNILRKVYCFQIKMSVNRFCMFLATEFCWQMSQSEKRLWDNLTSSACKWIARVHLKLEQWKKVLMQKHLVQPGIR